VATQSCGHGARLWWLKREFGNRVIARWRELDTPILTCITDSRGGYRYWQRGGGDDCVLLTDRRDPEHHPRHPPQPGAAGLGGHAGGLGVIERPAVPRRSGGTGADRPWL